MSVPALVCTRCGREVEGRWGASCPTCAGEGVPANLETRYDLNAARDELLLALDGPARGLARYEAMLPVAAGDIAATDVGDTALVDAPRLAAAAGVRRVLIKDESRGPTWSFKDRAAAVAAAHARVLGKAALVAASTGNAAAATAAHAQRAGLPAVLLLARGASPTMLAFVRAYGSAGVVATPTKADRWKLMRHCVEELDCYPNSNYSSPPVGNNPYAIDGYKTIGYEIWEQLGRRVPDAVYFAVCYGDGLFGVGQAFGELEAMGLGDGRPRLCGGEIYGSLERALFDGLEQVPEAPVDHTTAALSISSPQSTYQALRAVRDSVGWVSRVTEEELVAAQRMFAEEVGMFVEISAAASLAALLRHREEGRIEPSAEVVLINSSSGLKSVDLEPATVEPPLVENVQELIEALQPVLSGRATASRRSA